MRRTWTTSTLVVLVVLASCGDGSDDVALEDTSASMSLSDATTTSSSGGEAPPATASPPDTSNGQEGDNGGGDNGDDETIENVQWGPDDPPIPGEYAAFAAGSNEGLSCASIDDRAAGDAFWTLAAQICRVFSGEAGWPPAGSVPPTPPGTNSYETCLNGELADVLTRALDFHARHPGQTPTVSYPAEGTHSLCQKQLYDVGPVEDRPGDGDFCFNDESIEVPRPGIGVRIAAPGITGFANPRATAAGQLLCVVDDRQDNALRTFIVVVPLASEPQAATIAVETNYGPLHVDVELPAGEEPEPEPEPTAETTEGGSLPDSSGTPSPTDG